MHNVYANVRIAAGRRSFYFSMMFVKLRIILYNIIIMFWILFIYLVLTYFIPEVGVVAIICMIGPVAMSVRKGRYWCGHFCPRGSLFDKVISRFSPHRPIPKFVRTKSFRVFMLCFIFAMFGWQLYTYGFTWFGVGRVFWNIILITTLVGFVLSFVYAPRTWCTFCPMGTLSAWVAPKALKKGCTRVYVSTSCKMKCKRCSKMCPMQLAPYVARGKEDGYLHPDCIKCKTCVNVCPTKVMELR